MTCYRALTRCVLPNVVFVSVRVAVEAAGVNKQQCQRQQRNSGQAGMEAGKDKCCNFKNFSYVRICSSSETIERW